jgi:hypothetical protein
MNERKGESEKCKVKSKKVVVVDRPSSPFSSRCCFEVSLDKAGVLCQKLSAPGRGGPEAARSRTGVVAFLEVLCVYQQRHP